MDQTSTIHSVDTGSGVTLTRFEPGGKILHNKVWARGEKLSWRGTTGHRSSMQTRFSKLNSRETVLADVTNIQTFNKRSLFAVSLVGNNQNVASNSDSIAFHWSSAVSGGFALLRVFCQWKTEDKVSTALSFLFFRPPPDAAELRRIQYCHSSIAM